MTRKLAVKLFRLHREYFNGADYHLRSLFKIEFEFLTPEWLSEVKKKKILLFKEDLKVGMCYSGMCRNSEIAIWDGSKFFYVREKFSSTFIEDINHFEDDNGFDLFRPFFEVSEDYSDIPFIGLEILRLESYLDSKKDKF